MTIEQKEAAPKTTNGAHDGPVTTALPPRDVRRKRPPVLSFVLRLETLRRVARVVSLLALDFIGVVGGLFTALLIKLALGHHFSVSVGWHETQQWIAFAYLVTVLMFARADLYADRPSRPGLAAIATALTQATVIALVFALASGQHFNSYFLFYGSLFFGIVYITTLRYAHTLITGKLLEKAGYRRRALLVGSGQHIEAVAHALSERSHTPVDLVGYISLKPRPQNGLRSLGALAELPEVLAHERIQEVIIADPDFPQDQAVELVDQCHQRGVSVHIAPSTMEILFKRAEFVPGESVPLFTLRPPVFEGIDYAIKRTFDLVLSTALLVLLSPVLLASAIAVKLSSRGPVIYHSTRPGMAGRPFGCFKFRTMRVHADQVQADLESLNEATGALFKIRQDPRLTPVGRLLRRFSFDELPQLVNVIRGEMSLVGPRPLPMRDFERLEEWHKKRYLVLPGITGLWQVSGRSELDFDDLVRLDFLYLERWSVFLDLVIMLKTIPAVLSRRGAF
ncbi:MAG TPA: sugar transferase [Solirubrobacteraceae bacterium]|jgi:exopolysaccharide biosynthesis polyprenyl glycosylphosphotransferase|nr:sugar transferase [Solirubrobacteraceae bacterium]